MTAQPPGPQPEPKRAPKDRASGWRNARLAASLVYLAVAAWAVKDLEGYPALEWMAQYRFPDFQSFGDLGLFLKGLRSGVPPLLSSVEVSSWLVFGDVSFLLEEVYRTAFVLAFMVPFLLLARSKLEVALSWGLSVFFVVSAARIVPRNSQTYDIYFPLFALLFVAAVAASTRARDARVRIALAVLAGLLLASFELCRPFALLVVPLLLLHAWAAFAPIDKKPFVALLIPFLILSGGWHVKLFVLQDGQVLFSNHGGHNLWRGWKEHIDEEPVLILKGSPDYERLSQVEFRGTGLWSALRMDSERHTLNGLAYREVVARYVRENPGSAILHAASEIAEMLSGYSTIHRRYRGVEYDPPSALAWPGLYAIAVRLSAAYLLLNGLWWCIRLIRERRLALCAEPAAPVIAVFAVALVISSIGESGEEARFLVSLLPLLACLPRTFDVRSRNDETSAGG